MALVDDDVAVAAEQLAAIIPSREALDHRYVDSGHPFTSADDADLRRLEAEEAREALDPLLKQRPTVYEHERAARAASDQTDGHHRLARSGRSDQHSGLMPGEHIDRALLACRQAPRKAGSDRVTAKMRVRTGIVGMCVPLSSLEINECDAPVRSATSAA